MLGYDHFYYKTIRAMVASFGYLFSDIYIKRRIKDGTSKLIKIPLHFGPQDRIYTYKNTPTSGAVTSWPRLAFDFSIAGVAENRKTSKNVISQMNPNSADWMRNYIPYDFNFNLYVATTDIEDSLQIVEQILPFFQPSLSLKIKPLKEYPELVTDITIKLNSVENDFESEGEIVDDSMYYWTLSFVLEGFLFSPIQTDGIGIIDTATVNVMDWGFAIEKAQGQLQQAFNIDPNITNPNCDKEE
jgi:hypothetical protein